MHTIYESYPRTRLGTDAYFCEVVVLKLRQTSSPFPWPLQIEKETTIKMVLRLQQTLAPETCFPTAYYADQEMHHRASRCVPGNADITQKPYGGFHHHVIVTFNRPLCPSLLGPVDPSF